MVTAVTSFGRSGLSDWIIQRFTAVIMTAYLIFIVGFLVKHPDVSFDQWSALFSQLWVRIFTLAVIFSIAAHGWIGLWGVLTDYVTARMMGPKALFIRVSVLFIYAVVTLAFVVWGVDILWGS